MLLLIGMLIVASLPQMVEAAVGSHTVGLVRGRYALFGEFGYDVGGTLNFEVRFSVSRQAQVMSSSLSC